MQVLRGCAVLVVALVAGCSTDRFIGVTPDVALAEGTHMVPFKAHQIATGIVPPTGVVCPTGSFPSKLSLAGTATHLGKFTGGGYNCTAFTSPVTFAFVEGENNVIAANGDELWISLDPVARGQGSVVLGPTGPASIEWAAAYVVKGGTGRFAGATGQLTAVGSRDLTVANAPFISDIVGEISSVGSK